MINDSIALKAGHDIAVLLEVNRLIPDAEATAAVEASLSDCVRVRTDSVSAQAPRETADWAALFVELDQLAEQLLSQESEDNVSPCVHLFGCAPLPTMLYAGYRLARHRMAIYQQDRDSGSWTEAFRRGAGDLSGHFLEVEGLPDDRRPGRGDVVVSVNVTRSIADDADAAFRATTGLEPLAHVRLAPASGPSPSAVSSSEDIARAAQDFRRALDRVHSTFPDAERVLLALCCSSSLACALGLSVNPNAQHPLVLHNYRPDEGYVPVQTITAAQQHVSASRAYTAEDVLKATKTLEQVANEYDRFVQWITQNKPELLEQVGGDDFAKARIQITPADGEPFSFPYLQNDWRFDTGFALALKELREKVGDSDWSECLRLFFVHEGFHLRQKLTSYRFQGIGRAGFVLEAVDYDADALAVEVCLTWRESNRPGDVKADGPVGSIAKIVQNALRMMQVFDDRDSPGPLKEILERRLRRYLIWIYQFSRAKFFPSDRTRAEFAIGERVVVEMIGLPVRGDLRQGYLRPHVQLDKEWVGPEPELALYHRGQLFRWKDAERLSEALAAFREGNFDGVASVLEAFFDLYPQLVGRDS